MAVCKSGVLSVVAIYGVIDSPVRVLTNKGATMRTCRGTSTATIDRHCFVCDRRR